METPSAKLLPLLTRAAELRARASSWVKVAEHVRRSPETCRQWPRLYPELWRRRYREARGQRTAEAAVEAQLYHRKLVRHDDPRTACGPHSSCSAAGRTGGNGPTPAAWPPSSPSLPST
jgi:hypothetical protein